MTREEYSAIRAAFTANILAMFCIPCFAMKCVIDSLGYVPLGITLGATVMGPFVVWIVAKAVYSRSQVVTKEDSR